MDPSLANVDFEGEQDSRRKERWALEVFKAPDDGSSQSRRAHTVARRLSLPVSTLSTTKNFEWTACYSR